MNPRSALTRSGWLELKLRPSIRMKRSHGADLASRMLWVLPTRDATVSSPALPDRHAVCAAGTATARAACRLQPHISCLNAGGCLAANPNSTSAGRSACAGCHWYQCSGEKAKALRRISANRTGVSIRRAKYGAGSVTKRAAQANVRSDFTPLAAVPADRKSVSEAPPPEV